MGFDPGMFPVLSEYASQLNQSPWSIIQVLVIELYQKKYGLSTKLMKNIFGNGNANNVHGSSGRQKKKCYVTMI